MVNFKTTGPLDDTQDRAIYVERPEQEAILSEVRKPEIDAYLALLGSRQTGKTTLLYRVYGQLKRAGEAVAFLDLSAYRAPNTAQSYAHAATKIWDELQATLSSDAGAGHPKALRALAAAVDGPVRFREFLLQLARQCRGARIVILLDEVGAFMSNLGFFETIRSIASSRGHESEQAFKKYLFVFSGAVDLHDLTTRQNSPLANICKAIYLRDWEPRDTAKLVNLLAETAPVDAGVAAYVHAQTLGHPYLTSRLCDLVQRARPKQIDRVEIDRALERMLEEDENLRYVTRELERYPEAADLLRAILLEDKRVPFSMINPQVARLFVIGAIRRETHTETVDGVRRERAHCAVRNSIYKRSLRDYFQVVAPHALPAVEELPADIPLATSANGTLSLPPAVDPRNYLDFTLHVYPSPTRGDPFPVTVDSWAGSASGQLLLDVRSLAIKALLARLHENRLAPDDLRTLGAMLWQAIFTSPDVERRYVACQAEAGLRKGIRIKLDIESPDLMSLPWEYLYDPESQSFPALSPRTPITRYTHPRQQEPPPLAFEPPLRILLVSATPQEHPQLDVERERAQIFEAMERLQFAGKVEIEMLEHATVRNLQLVLRRPFHVLHYIGHGAYDAQTGSGMLALEDEQGHEHAVSAAQLHYLLRDTTIRLAVFNACMTAQSAPSGHAAPAGHDAPTGYEVAVGRSVAGELMRAGLSAALGMQFAISESSAT
ncbi:MAG: CHAT domain-containing protein, partial [Anaerolineae bacterium]|nr:CHAT domain-containing protein [Anaerolineae bacterium]